jgi:hypothetical protein
VGSYPTVSPLPGAITFRNPLARPAFGPSEGFPSDGHRGALHRRFIFCGTVRSRFPRLACANCAKSRPPGVTRRVALWSEAPFAEDFRPGCKTRRPRCPDFPPGPPSCEGWPSDHPACPPGSVYHLAAIARSAEGPEIYTESLFGRGGQITSRDCGPLHGQVPPRKCNLNGNAGENPGRNTKCSRRTNRCKTELGVPASKASTPSARSGTDSLRRGANFPPLRRL